MNTLVCTICCRDKDAAPGLLPARKRYRSRRIAEVGRLAREAGLPLAILSGKYGLIDADAPIPYYDTLLRPEGVPAIADANELYLRRSGCRRLLFLVNPPDLDPHVVSYLSSLEIAADRTETVLETVFIPPYPDRLE
ncbi:MAG TPA: hypothetical protein PK636_03235 [bacterium]|nr:hypothetical protein [bacterium]HPJ71678.1 hypothetical protein [bacterium]HPQ65989.1 hypothetical protein [bacterium]